jgi:osmotically inducible protein OsmC
LVLDADVHILEVCLDYNSINEIMKAVGLSNWRGTWKEGTGTISTASDTLKDKVYTFSSRFAGTPGASPEELLAAAQAGCFNQALANNLGMIGLAADSIDTRVAVELGDGADGFPAILSVALATRARVPGIAAERFSYCAERARTHCTIAVLLKLEIEMTAVLLP